MKIPVLLALLLFGVGPARADIQAAGAGDSVFVGVGTLTCADTVTGSSGPTDAIVQLATAGHAEFVLVVHAEPSAPLPYCGIEWHASSRTQHSASCLPPGPVPQTYSRDSDTYTIVQQPQCLSYIGKATVTTVLHVGATSIDVEHILDWRDQNEQITLTGVLARLT